MDSLLLPGTIPGLLARGCPVRVRMNRDGDDDWYPAIYLGSPHEDNVDAGDAGDAVLMLDADLEEDVDGWASVMSSAIKFVALDLSDPAGVDRAARWLVQHHTKLDPRGGVTFFAQRRAERDAPWFNISSMLRLRTADGGEHSFDGRMFAAVDPDSPNADVEALAAVVRRMAGVAS